MKKYQYSFGIAVGLFVGCLTAVTMGDGLTIFLAGILTAFTTTWIVTLEWTGKKLRALVNAVDQTTHRAASRIQHLEETWIKEIRKQESWQKMLFVAFAPVTFPLSRLLHPLKMTLVFILAFWGVVIGAVIITTILGPIILALLAVGCGILLALGRVLPNDKNTSQF